MKQPDTTTEAGQREASVMLARSCGWQYRHDQITGSWYEDETWLYDEWQRDKRGEFCVISLNLYDPANMALAWMVLNWAMRSNVRYSLESWLDERESLTVDRHTFHSPQWWILAYLPPEQSQRAWLDKILSLLTDEGMAKE